MAMIGILLVTLGRGQITALEKFLLHVFLPIDDDKFFRTIFLNDDLKVYLVLLRGGGFVCLKCMVKSCFSVTL